MIHEGKISFRGICIELAQFLKTLKHTKSQEFCKNMYTYKRKIFAEIQPYLLSGYSLVWTEAVRKTSIFMGDSYLSFYECFFLYFYVKRKSFSKKTISQSETYF